MATTSESRLRHYHRKRSPSHPGGEQNSPELPPSTFLLVQRVNAREHLPLQELQRCTPTCAAMRHLVLRTVILASRRCITSSDDGDRATLRDLNDLVHELLGPSLERFHLEDTHWPIPDDCFGRSDGSIVLLDALWTTIKTHESIGNALRHR